MLGTGPAGPGVSLDTSGPRVAESPRLFGKSPNSKLLSQSLHLYMPSKDLVGNMAAQPAGAVMGKTPSERPVGKQGKQTLVWPVLPDAHALRRGQKGSGDLATSAIVTNPSADKPPRARGVNKPKCLLPLCSKLSS